jgi:hypothetical protein
VYIYTNSGVLCEIAVLDPVCWYDANLLYEGSDPVGERNREFDAMRAQHEEEDYMEANQAPRQYPL